jgi:hypothetical protein
MLDPSTRLEAPPALGAAPLEAPPPSPRGARLVVSLEGEVVYEPPYLLRCTCEAGPLEAWVRHAALLAGAITLVMSGLAVVRAIPRVMLAISALWGLAAALGVLSARSRARQHGRFVVDLERELVSHERDGAVTTRPLAGRVFVLPPAPSDEHDDALEAALPRWLVLELDQGSPRRLRLAKAELGSLRRVLYLFRKHGVETRGA